jgi:CBS domain-containing protein
VTVEDLMVGPVDSCTVETDASEAARRMLADDVGSLAVVDGDVLVGIVTERDLLRLVADRPGRAGLRVGDVMTPNPDFLSPDVDNEDATDWMIAAGYRHLPVVDAGRVVGMVSMKDLLWAATERRPRRREEIR